MRLTALAFFSFCVLCVLAFASVPAVAAEGAKPDKAYIESIVHDYIMEHPEVFMQSLMEHQKKNTLERQQVSLSMYEKDVFQDKGSPVVGNPKGDVTVVEFMDYNCGYCKNAAGIVYELLNKDKNLRFIFKELPILGPTSELAAKWAMAAHKQGKYFDYHVALMQNRQPITEGLLEDLAKKNKLDVKKMKFDAESQEVADMIQKDKELANNLRVRGTPVFVIGDKVHFGALSLEKMEELIATERRKNKAVDEASKKK